jgi:hypothetical protein
MRTPILVEADTATDSDHPDASPSLEAAFFRKVVVRSSLVCGSTIFCCPKLTPFFLCARACACACAFHAIKGGITAGGHLTITKTNRQRMQKTMLPESHARPQRGVVERKVIGVPLCRSQPYCVKPSSCRVSCRTVGGFGGFFASSPATVGVRTAHSTSAKMKSGPVLLRTPAYTCGLVRARVRMCMESECECKIG